MNTNLVNYLAKKANESEKGTHETVKDQHDKEIVMDVVLQPKLLLVSLPQKFLKSNGDLRTLNKDYKMTLAACRSIKECLTNLLPKDRWMSRAINDKEFIAFEMDRTPLEALPTHFVVHEYLNSGEKNRWNKPVKSWACKTHYEVKSVDIADQGGYDTGTITLVRID